jgi:hypothetical protein
MKHRLEISDRIIIIPLGIIAQSLKIILLRGADKGKISIIAVWRRKLESRLADMFAALGFDEAIERIIRVVADGIDLLIGVGNLF